MDTFIDPALSTWHPVSGIWELEIENQQGTYVQSNMGRKQWHIAYTGNALLNDFYYSGKIEIQKGLKAGIFFRYQDENNYYRLGVHSNGVIRLIKKVNGIEEELLCRTMATNIQGVNVSSIPCFNNRIEIYLNTEFVGEVVDFTPELMYGHIGVGTYGAKVSFDDIMLNNTINSNSLPWQLEEQN